MFNHVIQNVREEILWKKNRSDEVDKLNREKRSVQRRKQVRLSRRSCPNKRNRNQTMNHIRKVTSPQTSHLWLTEQWDSRWQSIYLAWLCTKARHLLRWLQQNKYLQLHKSQSESTPSQGYFCTRTFADAIQTRTHAYTCVYVFERTHTCINCDFSSVA